MRQDRVHTEQSNGNEGHFAAGIPISAGVYLPVDPYRILAAQVYRCCAEKLAREKNVS